MFTILEVSVDYPNPISVTLVVIKWILNKYVGFINVPVVQHVPHQLSLEMATHIRFVTLETIDVNHGTFAAVLPNEGAWCTSSFM